jgi:hypothetical protein
VLAAELEALLLWHRGKRDEAVARLRDLANEEDSFAAEYGPPDIVKPTHELLGELLLELKRPAEAQAQFVRALELAPGRSPALLGPTAPSPNWTGTGRRPTPACPRSPS